MVLPRLVPVPAAVRSSSIDDRYMRTSLFLSVYLVGCLNVNMRNGEGRRQYRTRVMMPAPPPHSASSSWSSNPCCHASTCSLLGTWLPKYLGTRVPRYSCSFLDLCHLHLNLSPRIFHCCLKHRPDHVIIISTTYGQEGSRPNYSQGLPLHLTLCYAFLQCDWGQLMVPKISRPESFFSSSSSFSPPPSSSSLLSAGSNI